MGFKAQTRFSFWDDAAIRVAATCDQESIPEAIAQQAVKVADELLKARDERAAFLLQRKPGEAAEKAKVAAEEVEEVEEADPN